MHEHTDTSIQPYIHIYESPPFHLNRREGMRSIYMDKDHLKLKRSKKSYFSKTFYIFLIFIILHTKKAIHIYTCELLFSFALIAFKLGIYATFSYLIIITRYHHSLFYLFANGDIKLTYKKVASTSCSKRLL